MEQQQPILPDTLRAISLGVLIVAVLFRILHWPGADLVLVIAWLVAVAAVVARITARVPLTVEVVVRDLFFFGLVSVLVMTMLHLPGRAMAWTILAVGAVGTAWYNRYRFLPLKGASRLSGWLFVSAACFILVGALFRIQHWPFASAMLISGLVLAACWFAVSMRNDKCRNP